jgi:hypothetical protein
MIRLSWGEIHLEVPIFFNFVIINLRTFPSQQAGISTAYLGSKFHMSNLIVF